MRAGDSGLGRLRADSGRPETLAKVRRLRPLSGVTPGAAGTLSFDEINPESEDSDAATPETPARPESPDSGTFPWACFKRKYSYSPLSMSSSGVHHQA